MSDPRSTLAQSSARERFVMGLDITQIVGGAIVVVKWLAPVAVLVAAINWATR